MEKSYIKVGNYWISRQSICNLSQLPVIFHIHCYLKAETFFLFALHQTYNGGKAYVFAQRDR